MYCPSITTAHYSPDVSSALLFDFYSSPSLGAQLARQYFLITSRPDASCGGRINNPADFRLDSTVNRSCTMAGSPADPDAGTNDPSETEDKPVEIAELFKAPAARSAAGRAAVPGAPAARSAAGRAAVPGARGDSRASGSGSPGKRDRNKKAREQTNLFKAQMKVGSKLTCSRHR
ncbi:Hypp1531 [Branchiostoma lanceolatum]|uniref:Hypp1531 protein n=1 Tax=Branchiostoma lanceolatum TaxID=7740 RepID=A0A8J9ZKU1_BRALA|nr:Hypp1531 [Branchiostoma lanceolatum]